MSNKPKSNIYNEVLKKIVLFMLILSLGASVVSCGANNSTGGVASSVGMSDPETEQSEALAQDAPEEEELEQEESSAEVSADVGSEKSEEEGEETKETEVTQWNDEQKNSVAMLNYLTFFSQDINAHKNSRIFLEEAFDALVNNTNPENVDEITQFYLGNLMGVIERYRLVSVKRERLEYLYEQKRARAIRAALPNPVGLHGAVSAEDSKALAFAVIYMAIDSVSSYISEKEAIESEYLREGWELDDAAAETLHDNRRLSFDYMIEIVRDYKIPGKLALSEKEIEEFVQKKNSENNHQKIQFYEAEEETYEAFGFYWIERANSYYYDGKYKECLECITTYENIQPKIFRKDYYLAWAMPNAIASVSELYAEKDEKKYVDEVSRYLQIIIDNTEKNEWAIRYYAAQMYADLYARTGKKNYLNKAHTTSLNIVNELVDEQRKLNAIYVNEVEDVVADETASKEEKNRIADYNKDNKKRRETELPPVYEPLVVNCDLLFATAKELNISDEQKKRIDGILHHQGEPLFLDSSIDRLYYFEDHSVGEVEASFEKYVLKIPAWLLSEYTTVRVEISEGDSKTVYEDWVVGEVNRASDDYTEFTAVLTSAEAEDYPWTADSTVKAIINNSEILGYQPVEIDFIVSYYGSGLLGLGVWRNIKFDQVR